jgi:hypothetical protein
MAAVTDLLKPYKLKEVIFGVGLVLKPAEVMNQNLCFY